jgi:hypothetical protein
LHNRIKNVGKQAHQQGGKYGVNEVDEENSRHPANFSAASSRHTRDRRDLGSHAAARCLTRLANRKMAGNIPGHLCLKTDR